MGQIREIKITNTLTRKKETLVTRTPGKLSMYSCGPTVYGYIHIGNLRTAMAADLFYRYFKRVGYDVKYLRNYTDVDDKIIAAAPKEGLTPEQLTKKYITEVERDYASAGMLDPTVKPKATEHMAEMISMIETLIDKKYAYVAKDGEVLYSIKKFKDYGKLSHKEIEDLEAGFRVDVRDQKKDPLDFSLWKPAKPGEPSWESPWGKGRPGWHIECSAMILKHLGPEIDIHHGGEDLIFPHHENEIAQSEAACGCDQFVKYWVHSAHLTIAKEKMSKSVGNVFIAHDFLTQYSGEFARAAFLSSQYHSKIDFNEELIEQTLDSLQRIYEAKARAFELTKSRSLAPDLRAENLWGNFVADCEQAKKKIDDAYANDFNTAGALGELFTLIREFNRILTEPRATTTGASVLGAQALIQVIEHDIGGIIGIGLLTPEKAFEDLKRIRAYRLSIKGVSRPSDDEIQNLIAERATAKKNKDFARADQIRNDLAARGVVLKDNPQGSTTWEFK